MMRRLLLSFGLAMALWGCGGSTPPSGAESGAVDGRSGTARQGSPGTASEIEAAIDKLDEAESSDEYRVALDRLEKALDKDPVNVDGLMAFWENMREVQTDDGKDDHRLYTRAANLVRRALKTDRTLADQAGFRMMAADVFYNEACAKAVEKKTAECLAALREAVEFGWENLDHMSQDPDLDSVHDTAEYKKFFAEARQARKVVLAAKVARQIEETTPFEFDFDVEDVTGKRISKAGFAGKVVIVDFWGTWCRPCLMELPHFIALYQKYHDRGLEIVGFNSEGDDENVEETKTLVREFIEKR
jgi:thiol-disulfide isomerase/thioredoxin